jgi:hypothetical protein
MGRIFSNPYALCKSHDVVHPFLVAQTGFPDDELELLCNELENAFRCDQSTAHPAGRMNRRARLAFKPDRTLSSVPSRI